MSYSGWRVLNEAEKGKKTTVGDHKVSFQSPLCPLNVPNYIYKCKTTKEKRERKVRKGGLLGPFPITETTGKKNDK